MVREREVAGENYFVELLNQKIDEKDCLPAEEDAALAEQYSKYDQDTFCWRCVCEAANAADFRV